MKICVVSLRSISHHVAGYKASGGAEAQSSLLARTLQKRGHEVSVVLCDYDEAARRAERLTSIPLHNAFNHGDGIPVLRFIAPRWTGLHRALAEADAEIYFEMCFGAITGQVAFFAKRRRRAFVFATASDSDVDRALIRCGLRDRWIYEWGLRNADRIVTQHGAQARRLKESYGLPSTPIAMGVEIPSAIPEPDNPPTVMWLGTLRAVKRPKLWLDAARAFPHIRFVMVGPGVWNEPNLMDEVRNLAKDLPNVDFRGAVSDPMQILDRAWVLLNTSEVEGFPTTFLEAWARGIPTVSFFDPDGIVARDGLGRVAGNMDGLLASLREILESPAARNEAGRRGRSYVEREHAPDVVAERFEREFELALKASRR